MKLEKYRIPLQPAPERILDLVSKGVNNSDYPANDDVRSILDNEAPPEEGVWRAEDGRILIVCNTDFANANANMLDWWFGWHLPYSKRYQLWHPKAHGL